MDTRRRDNTPVLKTEENLKEINIREIFSPADSQETPDKAKAEIVKELMGKANLERVTEVSNFDIAMLASAQGVNSKVKSQICKDFIQGFLELRVSNARKGRIEVVDLTRNTDLQQQEQKGRFGRWFI